MSLTRQVLADVTQVSSTSRAASLATAMPGRRSRFQWSQKVKLSAVRLRRRQSLPRRLRPPRRGRVRGGPSRRGRRRRKLSRRRRRRRRWPPSPRVAPRASKEEAHTAANAKHRAKEHSPRRRISRARDISRSHSQRPRAYLSVWATSNILKMLPTSVRCDMGSSEKVRGVTQAISSKVLWFIAYKSKPVGMNIPASIGPPLASQGESD